MRGQVLALLLVIAAMGCTPAPAGSTYAITGVALAGPTCGAEPASPVPGHCAPRPVAGAVLVLTDTGGHEVVRVTTAQDGSWTVALAVGTYTLTPQPVSGLLGTARPVEVVVRPGAVPTGVQIEYDTGIR